MTCYGSYSEEEPDDGGIPEDKIDVEASCVEHLVVD